MAQPSGRARLLPDRAVRSGEQEERIMNDYGKPAAAFRKSTFSNSGGANCVEVAFGPENVFVRDSKDPDGPILKFTPDEWAAFIAGVNAGEFGQV
jgi:Domain of unknown function (DUF397)